MSEGKNSISVSFTHMSEDVIMPSDQLKYRKGLKFFILFFYIFFGLVWLLILFAAGLGDSDTWIAFGVLFGIPTLIALVSRWKLFPWIEIDRKEGVIKCWSNNRKNRLVGSCRKDFFSVGYGKVLYNPKGGGSCYEINIIYTDQKTKRYIHLFSLFDKTENSVICALTKSVEQFLNDFLNGKEIKPHNREYRFELPHR